MYMQTSHAYADLPCICRPRMQALICISYADPPLNTFRLSMCMCMCMCARDAAHAPAQSHGAYNRRHQHHVHVHVHGAYTIRRHRRRAHAHHVHVQTPAESTCTPCTCADTSGEHRDDSARRYASLRLVTPCWRLWPSRLLLRRSGVSRSANRMTIDISSRTRHKPSHYGTS